jgi:outer membrane receptor protein involved in Fe transport
VDYSRPVGAFTGGLGGALRYIGERYSDPVSAYSQADPAVELDAYTTLDLNASLSNDLWTLRLFVRNATDERAFTSTRLVADALLGSLNQSQLTVLQPRTIGVSFDVAF